MKLSTTVSLLALALVASSVHAADAAQTQPDRWAQDYTGRPADPAVVFGTLANGLRYAIMHNETPADGVAMRMRIGSGSIEERDDEQGLAHYLEHMAFRGSTNIPDGEVMHMLERQGLRFGPDTNAATAQGQTVYMFTFPKADATALDTGFTLFREIGQRLKLAPAAVVAEQGVILSEERLRDVPVYEAIKANLTNALAGTRGVARWPIGLVPTIKAATPERLRRYYEANYRPDNATIIVVGNIDTAKVEAEIKARFSNWRPAHAGDPIATGMPHPLNPAAEYIAPGAPDLLALAWVRPRDTRAETVAVNREQLLELVGLTVLNDRLADRAGRPGSPFVAGQALTEPNAMSSAALTEVGIAAAPAKWHEALAAVIQEQRQLLAGGVDATELQRAAAQLRTQFQVAVANAATRKSSEIADALVKATNDDQLFTSPAQDFELAQKLLSSLTPEAVNAALRQAFDGQGPVLFRSAQADPVTAAVLGRELLADYASPLSAQVARAAVVWLYSDFGTPGKILSQHDDKELGATIVTFANGSRLVVKPTPFEKNQIRVSVALGQGRKGADQRLVHALWSAELFSLGGTGKLPLADITRWAQANDKLVSANLRADTGAFTLAGATRPADLGAELELLTAFARDPGFRPELAEKLVAAEPMLAGQLDANAGATFLREEQRLTGGGDSRYGQLPQTAELAATTAADIPGLLSKALAGPADVTIVGDVTVADAIAATRATFGAGPAMVRGAEPVVHITMPAGRSEPYVVMHHGRADQAVCGELWALPDYFANPRLSYTADVAAAVLQSRLIDTVREKLGLTYSPQAKAVSSLELPGKGYLSVAIETPPTNFETFRALLATEIASLSAKPVSADELQRAKQPLIAARTKDFETNPYWLRQLPLVLRNPRAKVPTLEQASGIGAVTSDEVQDLLKRFVADKTPVVVIAKAW